MHTLASQPVDMKRHSRQRHQRPRIAFLAAWRNNRGLSQERLADLAGLTQGMVSQLERGASNYTGETLEILAETLRCTTRDLMFRPPEMAEGLAEVLEDIPEEQIPHAIEILRTFRRQ